MKEPTWYVNLEDYNRVISVTAEWENGVRTFKRVNIQSYKDDHKKEIEKCKYELMKMMIEKMAVN